MPYRSWAPPQATRKPVMTSSKISIAPVAVAEFAQACEVSLGGRDDAHVSGDGLDEEGGDLSLIFLEDGARQPDRSL